MTELCAHVLYSTCFAHLATWLFVWLSHHLACRYLPPSSTFRFPLLSEKQAGRPSAHLIPSSAPSDLLHAQTSLPSRSQSAVVSSDDTDDSPDESEAEKKEAAFFPTPHTTHPLRKNSTG